MSDLSLEDWIAIATHDVRDEDDFRVWCECGEELHWRDDDSLSECNFCYPDRTTNNRSSNE